MIAQSLIEKRRLRDYNVQRTATMTAIGFLFTVKNDNHTRTANYDAAKSSDFVQILGFLSMKNT